MNTLVNWVLRALVILGTTYLIPGFKVDGFIGALVLVLVLGLLNILVKPILLILALPVNILTLGLFTLIINAVVLQLAVGLLAGVSSDGFVTTLLASVVMSVLSMLVGKTMK